jgi:LysR family transcriptional regulator, chromosome initiation inhibitor
MLNLDPASLACLTALAETGSFETSAERLTITQSAVSHRLKTLETLVGQPLVIRTRPLTLTQTGQTLLRFARQLQAIHVDLSRELGRADHLFDERIPIAVNADSLATWVLPALDQVVQSGVRVDITVDDQDFTHEWLKQGSVLGCVSTNPKAMQGCVATELGSMRYVAAASPQFARQHLKKTFHASALGVLPFLVFNRKDDMQTQWVAKALQLRKPRLLQTAVPSSESYVKAIQMGWGIGVAPELMMQAHFSDGSLTPILPNTAIDVALYWHRWATSSSTLDSIGAALLAGWQRKH